ncbi:hypothetical protein HOK021_01940 [Streptomyces hygroscopicus]|nr:hypothetical protein HOK021_01940 [Streptomyces hygroscopicus]
MGRPENQEAQRGGEADTEVPLRPRECSTEGGGRFILRGHGKGPGRPDSAANYAMVKSEKENTAVRAAPQPHRRAGGPSTLVMRT